MRIIVKPLGVMLVQAVIAAMLCISAGYHAVQQAAATAQQAAAQSIAAVPPSEAVPPATAPESTAGNATGMSVYHEILENGWDAAPWTSAKDVDFASSDCPDAGGHVIRVRFHGPDGLKFHHKPLSTKNIDRITFLIDGGRSGGQRVQVAASFVGAPSTSGVLLPPLPAGKWVTVTLPLRELGATNDHAIDSFWIQGGSSKPQPALYINNIRLLNSNEPAPAGVTMAYTPLVR